LPHARAWDLGSEALQALSGGGGDLRWTLGYLAVAGVLIVLVSLIPGIWSVGTAPRALC
jgi:hypothetical protein